MPTATIRIPDTSAPAGRPRAGGTTYTLTDRFGTVHTRYSAAHAVPRYPFAVVRYDAMHSGAFASPGKAGVSYHGSRHLADVEAGRILAINARHNRACLVDVLPTTATPGRVK